MDSSCGTAAAVVLFINGDTKHLCRHVIRGVPFDLNCVAAFRFNMYSQFSSLSLFVFDVQRRLPDINEFVGMTLV